MHDLSLPRTLLVAAACAGALTSQRLVFNPPGNATVEANSRFAGPFGGTASQRFQQVCGLSADPTAIGQITRVAFRRDNDTIVASGDYVAFSPDFALTVSTSPRTTLTMSRTFANNIGSDATQVHTGVVNFPAQQKMPPGPTPFAYMVPFTAPFPYASPLGDILLDFAVTSANNTNTLFFCDADARGAGSTARLLGNGCPASSNLVSVSSNWGPGSTARILQYNAAGGVPSVLGIGSTSPSWFGLPLPVDLGIIGAPGCLVQHDNLVGITGMTSGTLGMYNGRWDVWLELPNNPFLAGLQLRTQFYNLLDTGIGNAANLSLSDGHEITFATPTPGVPPQSEAHGSATATQAALIQQGYGIVVEFQFL